MPGPMIKICGVTTPDALDATIRAQATHVGFNFFPPSPRFLKLDDAPALAEQAEGRLTRVGVFVDADDAFLADAIVAARLDAIQLHGKEDPARVAALRARFGKPVWKVISVASPRDVAKADAYATAADFLLFDAKTPKGAALPGGLGLAFDWTLLRSYKGPLGWGLAGGLAPENVADAARSTGAALVDVSSGVEIGPGVKNADRIRTFCFNARNA
ncbi:phosphoribosylanthranilate isomerase [Novosphingobium sp. ERN07]|uniref:phosphoribosylanthranilate isomerase n=1 Tax=Novosphingobium sp. ERN07 TaxID=2726187 RepID=UPI00145790BF|nr:phosphoribosylanthranilate isomerase [Novosphingobium sp. ERN07]NLR71865.1 phosphoribosylanthranilate isomerase [Novosphingobium sp. ERN07]